MRWGGKGGRGRKREEIAPLQGSQRKPSSSSFPSSSTGKEGVESDKSSFVVRASKKILPQQKGKRGREGKESPFPSILEGDGSGRGGLGLTSRGRREGRRKLEREEREGTFYGLRSLRQKKGGETKRDLPMSAMKQLERQKSLKLNLFGESVVTRMVPKSSS